ncbi:MAG: hypothetical protein HC871_08080 [Rhizobiales bacterium]|nr:hypothetical protein [Hyphomicrobiales bacterium]
MARFLGAAMIVIGVAGLLVSMTDWRAADERPPAKEVISTAEARGTEAVAAQPSDPAASGAARATEARQAPKKDDGVARIQGNGEQLAARPAATDIASLDGARIKVFDTTDQSDEPSSLPIIDIAAAADGVEEDGATANFLLSLSEPADRPIVIIFSTVDRSATSDADFQEQRGTVTFEPGVVSAEIRTPIIDDQDKEGAEQFSIVLNGAPGVVTFRNRQATATIKDND